MTELSTWVLQLLNKLAVIGIFAVLNLAMGMLVAVKEKAFKWERVPEFLLDASLYILAWFAAEAFSFAPTYFGVTLPGEVASAIVPYSGTAVLVLVLMKYVSSILGHFNYIKQMRVLTVVGIPPKLPDGGTLIVGSIEEVKASPFKSYKSETYKSPPPSGPAG